MKIRIALLRRVSNLLFDHLERSGIEEIRIEEDFYLDIPVTARYEPYAKPAAMTLGQLSSDVEEITRLAEGSRPTVGYALVWLSSVLRRCGEKSPA